MTLEEALRVANGPLVCNVQVGAGLDADVRASSYSPDKLDAIIARFGAQTVTGIAVDNEEGLIIQAREP